MTYSGFLIPVIKHLYKYINNSFFKVIHMRDFPGDAVVKNLPANAGDTASSPDPGRSLMPWSN